MKGLTLQEAEKLRELSAPGDDVTGSASDLELEILELLVEQGRVSVRLGAWEDDEYTWDTYEITGQGREALRLFEKLAGAA